MNTWFRVKAVFVTMCLVLAPAASFGASIDETIRDLQRQIDELKAQQQASQAGDGAPTAAVVGPKVTFGGQYRVNAYSADNDYKNATPDDNQTAARLRLRQNVDIAFTEQFKTHVQFELQHTTDNVSRTDSRRGGKSTEVSVRHAVMDYTFSPDNALNGTNAQVGIVPLQDYFHQTQFSADWDYNPLAVSFTVPTGSSSLRLFAANLEEGSESNADDDFVHYQADFSVPFGSDTGITLTGTALNIANLVGSDDGWHYNYGLGGHMPLGDMMTINGFVMGSSTDRSLLGSSVDADGVAVLAELTGSLGPGEYGVMASYTTGENDGTGFLMPMAFAQSFGYWGYTGILTVQGPTDTGFDGDGVNMSNNGYGMSSVQAKYSFPITKALSGYVSAGWYGNTDAGSRDDTVGTDFLAMGTYRFNQYYALDVGAAFASLEDSVSGYFQGAQNAGGPAFNQALGEDRDKYAIFSRIQAEF
jgi:hypothetical protein